MDAPGGKVPCPAPTGARAMHVERAGQPGQAAANTKVSSFTRVVGTARASAARSLSRVPIMARPDRDRRIDRTTTAARVTTARHSS